jgi:hypothetical protein
MSPIWLQANVSHQSGRFWKNSVTMKTDSIVVHLATLFYAVHIRSTNGVWSTGWSATARVQPNCVDKNRIQMPLRPP